MTQISRIALLQICVICGCFLYQTGCVGVAKRLKEALIAGQPLGGLAVAKAPAGAAGMRGAARPAAGQ